MQIIRFTKLCNKSVIYKTKGRNILEKIVILLRNIEKIKIKGCPYCSRAALMFKR
jgi:hypothetical protein